MIAPAEPLFGAGDRSVRGTPLHVYHQNKTPTQFRVGVCFYLLLVERVGALIPKGTADLSLVPPLQVIIRYSFHDAS